MEAENDVTIAAILKEITEVITMPQLSNAATKKTVYKWHKQIGDYIAKGDLIAEIETTQAIIDLESYLSGIVLYRAVNDGEKIEAGKILLVLGKCTIRNI